MDCLVHSMFLGLVIMYCIVATVVSSASWCVCVYVVIVEDGRYWYNKGLMS